MQSALPRTWLITGCSTGLGRALAAHAIARGERVVATARNISSLETLVSGHANAMGVALDVTDKQSIDAAISQAAERFGQIDVLVNNAGYGYISAVEEGDEREYRDMFEANLFGLFDTTRAVLPQMRQRRSGRIVNISSVGGVIGNPGSGFYAASKFAVTGFSEALSKEVSAMGIKVTVVQPGSFRTDWAGRSLRTSDARIADYAETVHSRVSQLAAKSGRQPGDPARAAEAIFSIVESPTPPLRLVLGTDAARLIGAQYAALQDELATWRPLSESVDFPAQAEPVA